MPAETPCAAGIDRARRLPIPAHAFPSRTPAALLGMARAGLDEAAQHGDGMRYADAHLAALRAASAVIAARTTPYRGGRRDRLPSVWDLLAVVAPELAEWAAFFAATTTKRAAAEAGIPHAVTGLDADELMRAAETFVSAVAAMTAGADAEDVAIAEQMLPAGAEVLPEWDPDDIERQHPGAPAPTDDQETNR